MKKLYEIVKENGTSVFQEAETFERLEGTFIDFYRYKNHTEKIAVYTIDFDSLERKRLVKKYPSIKRPDIFLEELFRKNKKNNIFIQHSLRDVLRFFGEETLYEEEEEL